MSDNLPSNTNTSAVNKNSKVRSVKNGDVGGIQYAMYVIDVAHQTTKLQGESYYYFNTILCITWFLDQSIRSTY